MSEKNIIKDKFEFILSEPIKIANNGTMEDALVIDFICPSRKLLKKSFRLQQMITRAMLSAQELFSKFKQDIEKSESDEESNIDASTIMSMLLASDVDIELVFNEFERLCKGGCAQINGFNLSQIQLDDINDNDQNGMLGEFLSNFILPLAMKNLSV